jgi:cytochrome c oxidase subunit 2
VRGDKPVQFQLESTDVLHAFYLPDDARQARRDPGPHADGVVRADRRSATSTCSAPSTAATTTRRCTRSCTSSREECSRRSPWDVWDDSTPEAAAKSGESLYKQLCASCHSVNGVPGIGPSWKGLFVKNADGTVVGRQRDVLVGGAKQTLTVDEAYITESIKSPAAKKLAAEFPNGGMSALPGSRRPEDQGPDRVHEVARRGEVRQP